MNLEELNKARGDLIEAAQDVLAKKGIDYAGADGDRLYNFKIVADLLRQFNVDARTPEGTWAVYWLKHCFAILAYIGQHSESEPILQRFVDARNYLDLGWGLIKEKQE